MSGYVSGRTSITTAPADRDNILLNGTNSSSANAGSALILDASAASTDVGSLIMYEDGSADNERFIDSVNEKSQIALVDKILLNDRYYAKHQPIDDLINEYNRDMEKIMWK